MFGLYGDHQIKPPAASQVIFLKAITYVLLLRGVVLLKWFVSQAERFRSGAGFEPLLGNFFNMQLVAR